MFTAGEKKIIDAHKSALKGSSSGERVGARIAQKGGQCGGARARQDKERGGYPWGWLCAIPI